MRLFFLVMGMVLSSPAVASQPSLAIVAPPSLQPLLSTVAREVMPEHPDITFLMFAEGSTANPDLAVKAMSMKNGFEPEKDTILFPFAIESIAIIAEPSCPLRNVSLSLLSAIFSGKIMNWRELGADNAPIEVYTREPGNSNRSLLSGTFSFSAPFAEHAHVVTSDAAMKSSVATHRHAIGYLPATQVSNAVIALSINDIPCDPQHVLGGQYPLSRKLVIVAPQKPSLLAEAFINSLYTEEGDALLRKMGYIPLPKENTAA